MKKILGILAVAALMAVACDQENHSGGDSTDSTYTTPKMPAPMNRDNNFGFSVNQSQAQDGMKNPAGNIDKVEEGTLPPGGTGVIVFKDAGPKEFSFTALDGKVNAGASFLCSGVFDQIDVISVSDGNAQLKFTQSGKAITLSAQVQGQAPSTAYVRDVCRNWVVEETKISIKVQGEANKLSPGGKFDGCKLSEISRELVDQNVNIKVLSPDYDITKIMIAPSGDFAIFFAGRDPYFGKFTLNGTEFRYKFTYYEKDDDNPVIAGEAQGKLWVANGKGRLNLKSDLKDDSGKGYSLDVTLVMTPEKPSGK